MSYSKTPYSYGEERLAGDLQPFEGARGRPAPTSQFESDEETLSLKVFGLECRIFDDPETAASLHAEEHLVACEADQKLRVDRFDVRSLLGTIPKKKSKPLSQEDLDYEAALDQWRYYDLQEDEEQEQEQEQQQFRGPGELASSQPYVLRDSPSSNSIT
eukprot:203271-Prorocentrum_minimum.AAC.2